MFIKISTRKYMYFLSQEYINSIVTSLYNLNINLQIYLPLLEFSHRF